MIKLKCSRCGGEIESETKGTITIFKCQKCGAFKEQENDQDITITLDVDSLLKTEILVVSLDETDDDHLDYVATPRKTFESHDDAMCFVREKAVNNPGTRFMLQTLLYVPDREPGSIQGVPCPHCKRAMPILHGEMIMREKYKCPFCGKWAKNRDLPV